MAAHRHGRALTAAATSSSAPPIVLKRVSLPCYSLAAVAAVAFVAGLAIEVPCDRRGGSTGFTPGATSAWQLFGGAQERLDDRGHGQCDEALLQDPSNCADHHCHCDFHDVSPWPTLDDCRHDESPRLLQLPEVRRVVGPVSGAELRRLVCRDEAVLIVAPDDEATPAGQAAKALQKALANLRTPSADTSSASSDTGARLASANDGRVSLPPLFNGAPEAYLRSYTAFWDERFDAQGGVSVSRATPWRDSTGTPMTHVSMQTLLDVLRTPVRDRPSVLPQQGEGVDVLDPWSCGRITAMGTYPAVAYQELPRTPAFGGNQLQRNAAQHAWSDADRRDSWLPPRLRAVLAAHANLMAQLLPDVPPQGDRNPYVALEGAATRMHADQGTEPLLFPTVVGNKRFLIAPRPRGADVAQTHHIHIDPFQPIADQEARAADDGAWEAMVQQGRRRADVKAGEVLFVPTRAWEHAVYFAEDTLAHGPTLPFDEGLRGQAQLWARCE